MTSPDASAANADTHSLIATTPELRAFCDRLAGQPFVTLDTEFIREKTYYPELCLIQVGTADEVACIDTCRDIDLRPLWTVLGDRDVLKVLHAARQDNEIFLHVGGFVPAPLFDTQIAAAIIGIGEQLGYAALIDALLGQHVDKSQSRTDWSRRPLTAAQLRYAADDVRHLVTAYHDLINRLTTLDRLDWALEDSARLEDATLYSVHPEDAWHRVRGAKRLRGPELGRIRVLAAWRECEAIRRNRPRRWIIRDDALLDLARQAPSSRALLDAIDSVPAAVRRRYAGTLIDLLEEPAPNPAPAVRDVDPRDPARLRRIDRLIAATTQRAEELELPRSTLASRSELEALADGERDLPVLNGWRRGVLGMRLLDTLTATD